MSMYVSSVVPSLNVQRRVVLRIDILSVIYARSIHLEMIMDSKAVNAAVAIKLALIRRGIKQVNLSKDLQRLLAGMNSEEYNEYIKRIH